MKEGQLNYLETAGNTNLELLNYPKELADFTAIYTANQTKGRGTKGKPWQETKGLGLAFSIVYNIREEQLMGISLVVGLAVRKALLALYNLDAKLKWSNDIIVSDKKLSGILCESRIYSKDKIRLVVGVGINIKQDNNYFIANNLPYGTSLLLENIHNIELLTLSSALFKHIKSYLKQLALEGFEKNLLEEYHQNCYSLNKDILLKADNNSTQAVAVGINKDGGLICRLENGKTKVVYSGEVSVRGLYGYVL